MRKADPLGDFGELLPHPYKPEAKEEEAALPPHVDGFLSGASTTTRETLGLDPKSRDGVRENRSPGVFDRDIASFRHCRFPCDIPWHRH